MIDTKLIEHLLNEAQALLPKDLPPPHDYQSLKARVAEEELSQAIGSLRKMLFSEGDFAQQFRDDCARRAKVIDDTALSYSALSQGPCNELYWKIAVVLFKPASLQEMLAILLPDVKTRLELQFSPLDSAKKLSTHNIAINIQETPLEGHFPEEPSLKRLSELVVLGNQVIDLRDLSLFDFSLHEAFFKAIQVYPLLARRLYQHNFSFRTLLDQLMLFSGTGQTPLDALTVLIRELQLGGEKMTGGSYASLSAQKAFTTFLDYLSALPDEAKTNLLTLTGDGSKSLGSVVNDLKRGKCIETAAQDLQKIKDKPQNRECLATHPTLSQDYILGIKQNYGKHHPLSLEADDSHKDLPNQFLHDVLPKIVITNAYEYLSILLSFPPELYSLLIQQSTINANPLLPKDLADLIRGNIFNEQQKESFFTALVENQQRFGFKALVIFCIQANKVDRLKVLLNSLEEKQRLQLLKETDDGNNTFFHIAAGSPDSLRAILALFPEDSRLQTVNEKDSDGSTVLHLAAKNPQSLRAILELLPKDSRLQAVKEKNSHGQAVLHLAVENPESLRIVLGLYPEDSRLQAVNEKDDYGSIVLHLAAENPESLRIILGLYPEDSRLQAVNEKTNFGYTALHLAVVNPKSLRIILELLPKDSRLQAVNEKNNDGSALLHYAARNPESLLIILELYPENSRLQAVNEKTKSGITVLHFAASRPESLPAILALLPEDSRLQAVKEKNYNDDTMLHLVASNPESLRIILGLYPENSRLQAVNEKTKSGITVLHVAARNPESLRIILELYPKDSRLEAVNEKNNDSLTVLHYAVRNPESLRIILELYPKDSRLQAVNEKNIDGSTLLHYAVENPESLRAILELLPEGSRLEAVKEKNRHGETALHLAAANPESLRIVLERMPIHDRFLMLTQKDEKGKTFFERLKVQASLKLARPYVLEDEFRLLLKELHEQQPNDWINELFTLTHQGSITRLPRKELHEMAMSKLDAASQPAQQLFSKRMGLEELTIYKTMADEAFVTDDSKVQALIDILRGTRREELKPGGRA